MTNPNTDRELRDEIARAIDARCFEYEAKSDRAKYIQDADQKVALKKADAILALLPAQDGGLREALERKIRDAEDTRKEVLQETPRESDYKIGWWAGKVAGLEDARQALASPAPRVEGEPCPDFPCAMDCVGGCEKLAGRARPFTSLPEAAIDVLDERKRQIEKEGWSEWHDDQHHDDFELARAAGCYALNVAHCAQIEERSESYLPNNPATMFVKAPRFWPWLSKWWKPKNPRRDLVRAAALIIAEIERLDRSAALSQRKQGGEG